MERGICADARRDKLGHHLPVRLTAEPLGHAGSQFGTDLGDLLHLLEGGGGQGVQRAKVVDQELGHGAADALDAQRRQQPGRAALFAGLDGGHQVGHLFLAKALQGQELAGGQGVDVGHVAQEAEFNEQLRLADAKALDIHRPAADKVLHAPDQLGYHFVWHNV